MRKLLLAIAALLLLAIAAMLWLPTRALLVAYTLPNYPDWPAPQAELGAGDEGRIYYPTRSPYDLERILERFDSAPATTGLGYLSFPKNAQGPVPAMVILPGSGGIQPGREHDYARWLNQRGIAAFVVEYYEPRGFDRQSSYAIRTSAVTEFDLVADAYASLRLLGSSPLIDDRRIGVMGFSYGGMAARLAMDERIRQALADDLAPFALHIDVYGPCFQDLQSPAVTGAPILTLRGTEDASNELPACARREHELRALGAEVTAVVYQGAGHAWENDSPRSLKEEAPYLSGCEVVYDLQGRPFLNAEPLNQYAPDASLATRVAARFSSGLKFRDCVGYGYIVGRDEATRNQAFADVEAFLTSNGFLTTVPTD
ncbi:MAG: dienelactone hydrolase family protein [Halieaceae bacterium]|jgi:dienelactone hydrolase|nr:dienelactone hydrolase family protein [Halieaceae bacterium]